MEDKSRELLKRLLPSEWIVRRIAQDYGVDAEVEVVDGEAVTGERIWIQLKAQRLIRRRVWKFTPRVEMPSEVSQDGTLAVEYIQVRVDTHLLKYALQCPFPLILMVADLTNEQLYWVSLRDEVLVKLDRRSPSWREQTTVTLKIPASNELSLDSVTNYYGIRWYAREPARLFALSCLQHYVHEFQYMRNVLPAEFADWDRGPEGIMDFVWPPFPRERISYELGRMKDSIAHALGFEILFGDKGVDVFRNLAPYEFTAIAPQLRAVVKVLDNVIAQFKEDKEFLSILATELHSIEHAFTLMSLASSMYHELRAKFLLTEHAAVWITLSKASGLTASAPRFPFNWAYEEVAYP